MTVNPEDDTAEYRRWAAERADRRTDRFWMGVVGVTVTLVLLLPLIF